LVMAGMYVVYWVHAYLLQIGMTGAAPVIIAGVGAIIVVAMMGLAVHQFIIAPILNTPPINQLLATGGLLFFLQNFATVLFSTDFRNVGVSLPSLHLGEISLECSRAGASAVALWTTQRLFPLVPGGKFGQGLSQGREAALTLCTRIAESPLFFAPTHAPQLDIVFWAAAAATPAASSELAQKIFDEAAKINLHLALARLSVTLFEPGTWPDNAESTVLCLRSVLMKPEHLLWIERIWTLLQAAGSTATEAS